MELVKTNSLCLNCLYSGHMVGKCMSKKRCFYCQKKHHSLLHIKQETTTNITTVSSQEVNSTTPSIQPSTSQLNPNARNFISMCSGQVPKFKHVLLATALVNIISSNGNILLARALLDQGSQASFITESVVQTLRLEKTAIKATISGIGNVEKCESHGMVSLSISNIALKTLVPVEAFVLQSITQTIPGHTITVGNWDHLEGLELADPKFFESKKIDLLLGADVYARILQEGIKKGASGTPVAQKTSLGWILSGEVENNQISNHINIVTLTARIDLDNSLQKFWQLEEIPQPRSISKEDEDTELFYQTTTKRSNDGRYIVQLPFKETSNKTFGRSRHIAIARLLQLESQFKRKPDLQMDYSNCVNEYTSLGHMEPIDTLEFQNVVQSDSPFTQYKVNYLPHHAVFKESSTTKTRVVFNASSKNADGISLNDKLQIGPTIQKTLVEIILGWRKHRYAFTADLHKMYRQIEVTAEDADFQRIVWRNNINEPIRDFCLKTVTFGTSSAPFLAIRTIQQLAYDEGDKYPLAKKSALEEFYVDDLLSGADSVDEALEKQNQINSLMKAGKFELRKWSSNSPALLQSIPQNFIEMNSFIDLNESDSVKALGIHWHPLMDNFSYKVALDDPKQNPTKRMILSEVAKLFDPMGWIAPVVISAKILIQQLWLSGLDWDDEISMELKQKWLSYRNTLQEIENVQLPRWMNLSPNTKDIQIHGFSDASQQAYAAAVYLRTKRRDKVNITLIAAKTKVAPIKTISLPRLELCGAVLLTKLIKMVCETLDLKESPIYAWSDSQIVLDWIKDHPSRWTTFVANRVSLIHTDINATWSHISSGDNLADCASRGVKPSELIAHHLWWEGPAWLKEPREFWPQSISNTSTNLEKKKISLKYSVSINSFEKLYTKYSKLKKLLRITAVWIRFIKNCHTVKANRMVSYITAEELHQAEIFWIKFTQKFEFASEIKSLQNNQKFDEKSKIMSLTPFLDENEVLRVGGRLQKSELKFQQKHPILIHDKTYLAKLVIAEAHENTMHSGPQLMTAYIRQKFWIPNLKNLIRLHIHKCIPCYRQRAGAINQLMGNLPQERITACKPFYCTGVDYCGPFEIKASSLPRSPKMIKCYVAIFICMTTKAVHIEVVSSLTTESFIAAFRRFISRRGYIGHINMYSDNGTNFVGAEAQLRKEIANYQTNEMLANVFANNGISWHFIPPKAPTFGGLWEAAVKSTEYHLRRTLQGAKLSFEEFSTALTQVEACLNSRPLMPMSSDPNDLQVLTPGHFLTGDTMITFPGPSFLNSSDNRLNRWQYLQKLVQTFWNQWSSNYLSNTSTSTSTSTSSTISI